MPRRRKNLVGLSQTRIYQKGNRLYLFSATPIPNPSTGKVAKWHSLCSIDEGEERAREAARQIVQAARPQETGKGNMPNLVRGYLLEILLVREKKRPADPARERMFKHGNTTRRSECAMIARSFEDFDVDQIMPHDVATFVDQWAGQRAAALYRARLSDFFRWAIRRGHRHDNPAQEIRVEKPPARRRRSPWHPGRQPGHRAPLAADWS